MKTSDAQVKELWDRLDVFHQENASLKTLVQVLEGRIEDKEREIEQLRNNEAEIMKEVGLMGTELNKARQAAADAVKDHLALIGS
jgi:translation initiation factor 2B subunit (eIF-2B alpha/beta/delta family)